MGLGQLEVRETKHGYCQVGGTILAGRAMKDEYFKMYSCASNIIFIKIEYNLIHDFYLLFSCWYVVRLSFMQAMRVPSVKCDRRLVRTTAYVEPNMVDTALLTCCTVIRHKAEPALSTKSNSSDHPEM